MYMNRAQRRQAELMQRIQQKKQLLDENKGIEMRLRKAEAEMRDEISHYYMGAMYTAFILVLRKSEGFGKKRINRVLSELAAIINDLDDGTIDISDLKRDAEEIGMTIRFDCKRNIVSANIFEEEKEDG